MRTYFLPIETAAILFPLIAALLTLPYLLYCYRKFGSVSFARTIILFSFLFYLQCAFFLVILPLPDPATVVDRTGPFMQLVPFSFVRDFFAESGFVLQNSSTWLPALKSSSFLQPLFNVLLTVPFGMYLSYYFKKNFGAVLVFSFVLTFFFEVTQLTGLYGLYENPYRLFDVDDLLLNTLGGILGHWIATRFLRFLPSRDRIDQRSRQKSVRVSYTRRLIALVFDILFVTILQAGLVVIFNLNNTLVSYPLTLCVYSIGVPLLFRGSTIGKALVHIRIEGVKKNAMLRPLILARYLIRTALILSLTAVPQLTMNLDFPLQLIGELYPFAMVVLFLFDVAWSLRKDKRLFYERLSKTRNVSTFRI